MHIAQAACRQLVLHGLGVGAAGTGQHQRLLGPGGCQFNQRADVFARRHAAEVQQVGHVSQLENGLPGRLCQVGAAVVDHPHWFGRRGQLARQVLGHVVRDGHHAINASQATCQAAAVALALEALFGAQEIQIVHRLQPPLSAQRRAQAIVLVERVPERKAHGPQVQPALGGVGLQVAHIVAKLAMPLLRQMEVQMQAVLLTQRDRPACQGQAQLARKLTQAVLPMGHAAQADAQVAQGGAHRLMRR